MLTSACCSDRSQAGGLAGLQALQLNQTPRSECKHFNRVMHCISTIPVCTKALSGLLLVKRTNHHCKDYPQELNATFAPLGLFICITACWFYTANSGFPCGAIIECDSIQISTNPLRQTPLAFPNLRSFRLK